MCIYTVWADVVDAVCAERLYILFELPRVDEERGEEDEANRERPSYSSGMRDTEKRVSAPERHTDTPEETDILAPRTRESKRAPHPSL